MTKRRKAAFRLLNYYSLQLLFGLLFSFFTMSHVKSQDFQYGIGITLNGGKLAGDAVVPVDSFSLERTTSILLGGNAFIEWAATDAFSLRLTTHYNIKGVRPILTQDFGNGKTLEETFNYQFSSLDFGIMASYNVLPSTSKWKISPQLGFAVGWSKLQRINLTKTSNNFNDNLPFRTDSELDATIQDKNAFLYTALQTGINIQPPLRLLHRQVEFNTTFYYSPRTFLENPITLAPFEVEGKYHFVSVGMNLFLNKSKN